MSILSVRPRVVAIERWDHLGDAVACLPMAAMLKRHFPGVRVLFMGRPYVRPLVEACVHVDEFLDIDAVLADPDIMRRRRVDVLLTTYLHAEVGLAARRAGVRIRVGNLRRYRSLRWANRFIWQGNTDNLRHMTAMNLRYLRPLGVREEVPEERLWTLMGLERIAPLDAELAGQLDAGRFNLLVHAKSNKSGREWPAAHFARLLGLLPAGRFNFLLTGSARERDELARACPPLLEGPGVRDLMGRTTLPQLLALINRADGMVAGSTGPLHIAAALGLHALGLYPGRRNDSAFRWRPLGRNAETVSFRTECLPGPGRCPGKYAGEECSCMTGIEPETVAARILAWPSRRRRDEEPAR